MSIQKKSLINTLHTAKKANLAKGTASSDVSKSSAKASPNVKHGFKASPNRKMLTIRKASTKK
jgi:hypothetical protein